MMETTILNEKQLFREMKKYIGKNKAESTIDMMKSGILAGYVSISYICNQLMGYKGVIVCKKLDEDKFEFITY